MEYTTFQLSDIKPGLRMITLNNPERLNAISFKMVDELRALFTALHKDRDCRVLIMTGAGRCFCAGLDLQEMKDFEKQENHTEEIWYIQKYLSDVYQMMRAIPQPIICAVNGAAAGGGMSFAMASDIRICEPKSKFILSYANIGLSACDMGSSYFLPRLVGMSRASDYMLTGRPVLAEEAERAGLVSRIVPFDELIPTAVEYADMMLSKSDFGLRLTKEGINLGTDAGSLANQVHVENRNQFICSVMGPFDKHIESF